MANQSLSIQFAPMPRRKRFGIAVACSLGFHLAVFLLAGLFAFRAPVVEERLIPVELTVLEQPQQRVIVAVPENSARVTEYAPTRVTKTTAPIVSKKPNARPSNAGGTERRALSAPRILSVKKNGGGSAGETGNGTAAGGPGGKVDSDEGPTYGPAAIGGGGPLPIYPKNALDQNLEGSVTLTINVGDEGAITSVEIAKSSGHKILDEAAVRAIRKGWAFKPGMTKGKLTPGKSTITFEFSAGAVK